MLRKIFFVALVGIPAVLCTYTAIAWWIRFGLQDVYPVLGTILAALMWTVTILTITEKED